MNRLTAKVRIFKATHILQMSKLVLKLVLLLNDILSSKKYFILIENLYS